jgi:hypothetical protein
MARTVQLWPVEKMLLVSVEVNALASESLSLSASHRLASIPATELSVASVMEGCSGRNQGGCCARRSLARNLFVNYTLIHSVRTALRLLQPISTPSELLDLTKAQSVHPPRACPCCLEDPAEKVRLEDLLEWPACGGRRRIVMRWPWYLWHGVLYQLHHT